MRTSMRDPDQPENILFCPLYLACDLQRKIGSLMGKKQLNCILRHSIRNEIWNFEMLIRINGALSTNCKLLSCSVCEEQIKQMRGVFNFSRPCIVFVPKEGYKVV